MLKKINSKFLKLLEIYAKKLNSEFSKLLEIDAKKINSEFWKSSTMGEQRKDRETPNVDEQNVPK